MNENPSVTIVFDSITMEVVSTKLAATSDFECEQIRKILAEGIKEGEKDDTHKN